MPALIDQLEQAGEVFTAAARDPIGGGRYDRPLPLGQRTGRNSKTRPHIFCQSCAHGSPALTTYSPRGDWMARPPTLSFSELGSHCLWCGPDPRLSSAPTAS